MAHQAIPKALQLAAAGAGCEVEGAWIPTSSIENAREQLSGFDGIWCVPASPYANPEGALEAIRYARERERPFLGTCAGFQHALIEYARNVCGLAEADHAETNPQARIPVIAPLSCPLIEETEEIAVVEGTLLHRAYGETRIAEGYHCRYGVNPEYLGVLFRDALQPSAHDPAGQVRAAELAAHPFFVATLFQPERRALRSETPPVVAAFVRSMAS
jgi:CTP synthase (UTP-ammonia lyase)